jgi:hypothetical protein
MIYLITAIRLSSGGSTHLHTNSTWNNTNNNRTTQITTNVEECGPCPVFTSFTVAFTLQLRKKHGKTLVRTRKTSVLLKNKTSVRVQYTYWLKTWRRTVCTRLWNDKLQNFPSSVSAVRKEKEYAVRGSDCSTFPDV